MAYNNGSLKIHDTPLFVPTTQLRANTSALATFSRAIERGQRYIYYTVGGLFYRYDTVNDVSVRLATPMIAPVTGTSLEYSDEHGYYGNALAAGASTITIAGLNGKIMEGLEIEIISGTGAGQIRTITAAAKPAILDTGVVTATSGSISFTDSTKRWRINEFIGYQVRLVFNTGQSQVRKILYNNETTITLQDANFQQLDSWNNTQYSSIAPYALPVSTPGSQANYQIESCVLTVNSAWDVQPDSSSAYVIKGGGVFLLSAVAGAPFASWQYYDVLSDVWTVKTPLGGLLTAALNTDYAVTLLDKSKTYATGTATAGSARGMTDSGLSLAVDRYANFELRITGGTGVGQKARIVGNSATAFEIEKPWVVQPTAGSTYAIYGNSNIVYLTGNGASIMYQYLIDQDQWVTGQSIDYGQTRNISAQFAGQEAFGVTSGARNTGGITVLNATPTAGGTGYAVGDIFNITTGGTVGKGRVEAISAGGIVTSVSLYSSGLTYTTGSGKATTNVSGTGTGLTVDITTVGTVGRITLATNHNLLAGDSVTFSGCNDAAWNGAFTILATDSLTTFDVVATAAGSMVASNIQSTVLIVDSTKNWAVNEHAGKIIKLEVAGTSQTTQLRRIVSNTATTITVTTIVAGVNGTSRYAIMQPEAFGRDRMYDADTETSDGYATGGTSTTLVDSSKTWFTNQWAGFRIRIIAGTGVGSEFAITSNTATTLTYSAPGFTPDTTTKYMIMSTFGIATSGTTTTLVDTTKNWIVNKFAGKRIVLTAGTSQRVEATIASNTANTITFTAAIGVAPDTTTCYTILAIQARSTATRALWLYNQSNASEAGNFLMSIRGGGVTTIDIYDITRDLWDLTAFYSSQDETFNIGCSYAYDGEDTVYLVTSTSSDFIYVLAFDVTSRSCVGAMQSPFLQGTTVHIGNFASIVESADGGVFLFIALCTSRLMYKCLIR
jgi:ribosomal protein L19